MSSDLNVRKTGAPDTHIGTDSALTEVNVDARNDLNDTQGSIRSSQRNHLNIEPKDKSVAINP